MSGAAPKDCDVLALGAGAAGLMAAIFAGRRGRRVVLLDHSEKIGEKIRISGGGRCNFTNLRAGPKNYLSENPKFCVSALARFTPRDFIAMVDAHKIAWHEKTLGQLFCDGPADQITRMLLDEAARAGVVLEAGARILDLSKPDDRFQVVSSRGTWRAPRLVLATGGPSIPQIGATSFAYEAAARFGLPVTPPRPALTPLLLDEALRAETSALAGVSLPVTARTGASPPFSEAMLFTHKGLSGPAILQISSYWRDGEEIRLDLAPDRDVFAALVQARAAAPRQEIRTALGAFLPQRLALWLAWRLQADGRLADASNLRLKALADGLKDLRLTPSALDGWRIAEVAAGGIDVRALDSQTMEARTVPGLHVAGECVDVTGWLGGYNFQWAWASGAAAGRSV